MRFKLDFIFNYEYAVPTYYCLLFFHINIFYQYYAYLHNKKYIIKLLLKILLKQLKAF